MRAAFFGICIGLCMVPAAGHANPIGDFFRSSPMERPRAGDCAALAREIGPQATWYGEYSGSRFNFWSESYTAYSARGCFESEFACRRWQNESITWSEGKITYTFCRPGVPARYLR